MYVMLMIFAALINYVCAVLISGYEKLKRYFLILAITFNLGILGIFKYAGFFVETLNHVIGRTVILSPDIKLPIGISFFIFQSLSYTVDVYRKNVCAQTDFSKLLLYISFFPQLIAGPIIKYHDIENQLTERIITAEKVAGGVHRFIIGLSKKVLLANTMGLAADNIYMLDSNLNILLAWLFAVCYIFQIYFDFSGYSDMAIGLGKMFGFDFKENFNYPYISEGIQEFWRRWHISLSTWFKEYVYIPLGGNRGGTGRTVLNKFIVFLLTGLWHGASWNFVVWGVFHGFFLILESCGIIKTKKWIRPARHIYLIFVVSAGFVIFRSETLTDAIFIISEMLTGFHITEEGNAFLSELLTPSFIFVFLICVTASMPAAPLMASGIPCSVKVKYGLGFLLFLLCILELSAVSYNPFIYFRF